MKKWLVIGMSAFAISVWVLFFFLLIGEKDSLRVMNQSFVTYYSEQPEQESQQFVRFATNNEPDASKEETVHSDAEERSVQASNDNHEQVTTNPTQKIMYELEKKNPVSIDDLLAALNLE